MLAFIVRRLLITFPVLLGILVLGFILVRMLPGDPARMMISPDQLSGPDSEAYLEAVRKAMGLDQPMPVQFFQWVRAFAQGDFGYSFRAREPVLDLVLQRLPATLLLTATAVVIAVLLGLVLGVLAADRQNSPLDYGISAASMLAISIPVFFLGLVAILLFSITLRWLPTGGVATPGDGSAADVLLHLIMPAAVLSSVLVGPYVRYTRASMLDVLSQDFITTSIAKGASRRRLLAKHALPNALVPLVTVVAVQVPQLLAGAVVIETVFSWPGLGLLTIESITGRDYPVILAIVLLSALLVVNFTLIADIIVAALDPRVRLS